MQQAMLCFSVGVLSAALWPALPSPEWLYSLLTTLIILSVLCRFLLTGRSPAVTLTTALLAFVVGQYYGVQSNLASLQSQYPEALDRSEISIVGVIEDLPINSSTRQKFTLRFKNSQPDPVTGLPNKGLLRLSWYEADGRVAVGESWKLRIRLKSPRGFVNPAGMDYQAWLLRSGISATGIVRSGTRIESNPRAFGFDYVRGVIANSRHRLRSWVDHSEAENKHLLKALIMGDKTSFSSADWRRFQNTGTAHLFAISGLHVGLVALLGFTLGGLLGRALNTITHRINGVFVADACAMGLAISYSALANFSTPTVRALIMLLAAQLCIRLYRRANKRYLLGSALMLVALVDPLSIWDAGFWLSFGAATALLVIFVGRSGSRNYLADAIRSQWFLFCVLLIPLYLIMFSATLLAPIANIFAIPLVSFLVAPLLLLAVLLEVVSVPYSFYPLAWADQLMTLLLSYLDALTDLDLGLNSQLLPSHTSILVYLFGLVGAAMLVLPRGIAGRFMGYPLLLLALYPLRSDQQLQQSMLVTFLDVGQGAAVVIEVDGKTIVYDAGPSFSRKFNAGSGIVSPYLNSKGISRIDRLVLSHGDADHSGGAAALAREHPVVELSAPKELVACLDTGSRYCLPAGWNRAPVSHVLSSHKRSSCEQVQHWRWGFAEFQLFSARTSAEAAISRDKIDRKNNRSCLLRVNYQNRTLVLSGDIEKEAELRLLRSGRLPQDVDWLSAPHHGSRTSSTAAFVQHLNPKNVVFQFGHNNSYRHPNDKVMERYVDQASNILATDSDGAIQVRFKPDGEESVTTWREAKQRFWL